MRVKPKISDASSREPNTAARARSTSAGWLVFELFMKVMLGSKMSFESPPAAGKGKMPKRMAGFWVLTVCSAQVPVTYMAALLVAKRSSHSAFSTARQSCHDESRM